jgi:hypothetical protein
MSKYKFPDAGLVATLGHSIRSNTERNRMGEPCFAFSDEGGNTSAVKAWYILYSDGFRPLGYHGKKCPQGNPTPGGPLGYFYDNYVQHAIRIPRAQGDVVRNRGGTDVPKHKAKRQIRTGPRAYEQIRADELFSRVSRRSTGLGARRTH